ncbi:MAG TPA: SRPBCC domain-containing protein [Candidatus Nesterenkonia stercoripullorum]|uniref:SRPBCC domain-containing protein n=1 Tax=Candidatus Nesterenkonia stercoripullorum TaxID=2838701 RepID=A0A9D1S0F6_9MICC|nr:SRPBCC domain-containing protein [Candidatus Nesterenkonia stercoripullorum]
MTGTTAEGIEIDRDFAASPAAVFAAWTTPQHFARWFGGKDVEVPVDTLDFIAEPGRTWQAQMILPNGTTIEWTGRFNEVIPDERLVFTLTDRPGESVQAEVVVELTAIATGTRMHFTQQTPDFSAEEQESLITGWESFIDELERIASA